MTITLTIFLSAIPGSIVPPESKLNIMIANNTTEIAMKATQE